MSESETSETDAEQDFLELVDGSQGVIMATVDETGEPEASYAPFVRDEGLRFYVYLSELARHTNNLLVTGKASLLWLGEESNGGNPFARRRLVLRCGATRVDRDCAEWASAVARLQQRFGGTMALLRQLGDFHLFRLQALAGTYVLGFGRAYTLSGECLATMQLSRGVDKSENRS